MKKTTEGRAGMCLWENLRNAEITKSKFLFFCALRVRRGNPKRRTREKACGSTEDELRPGRSTVSKGVGFGGWLHGLHKEGNPRA